MRSRKSAAVALLGMALMLSSALVAPVFATASGTGRLYMYSDSTGNTLLPQADNTGTLGYILPATGTTIYVQVKNITESSALSTSGCNGGAAECTNIKLLWNGHTEILSGIPVTEVTAGCPGGYTCWNTGLAPWVVGTFGSTSQLTVSCGQTGIVVYGQGTSNSGYYAAEVDGSSSSQGHFYGPGTTANGSCAVGAPEFPLGILPLLALTIPILLIARLRLSRNLPGRSSRVP